MNRLRQPPVEKVFARRLTRKPGKAEAVSLVAPIYRVAVSQLPCQVFPSTQHPAPSTQHPILRLTVEVGNW